MNQYLLPQFIQLKSRVMKSSKGSIGSIGSTDLTTFEHCIESVTQIKTFSTIETNFIVLESQGVSRRNFVKNSNSLKRPNSAMSTDTNTSTDVETGSDVEIDSSKRYRMT